MIKKISHIIISLSLLVSTTSYSISKHYCGDNLISFSVLSEAEFCCTEGNCCHNETISLEAVNDFIQATLDFDFIKHFDFSILQFAVVYTNFLSADKAIIDYSELGFRPKKSGSILSLIQVFRL